MLFSPKYPAPAKSGSAFLPLAAALATYVLAVARWGYEYGRGDQMQLLSYALFLRNPRLYPHDFFIQNISAAVPNERYFFTWLISWLTPVLEPACFVLHLLFGVYLFYLCFKLASRFIRSGFLCWVAVLLVFIPLYNINLGGNELYYNTFFVSNPVKALGLQALLWLLNRHYFAALAMAALCTLLQPVNGVQLFVTFSGILLLGKLFGWLKINWWQVLGPVVLYAVTGLAYLLVLHFYFRKESVDDRLFFDILFHFRAPHHYLPHAFGLRNYLVLLPLFLVGFVYYLNRSAEMVLFFAITTLGCLVYVLGTEVLHLTFVASLQWFKATIWLKLFSVIALVGLADQYLPWVRHRVLRSLTWLGLFGGAATALVVVLFYPRLIPWKVPYDFGNQHTDPAIDIALQARANTPTDAVFVHPMTFTELKYYGQRSSMVDYRVLVHRQDIMVQWHERISNLYNINYRGNTTGYQNYPVADANFARLSLTDLAELQRSYGITHVLTPTAHQLPLTLVAKNSEYQIYRLPQP